MAQVLGFGRLAFLLVVLTAAAVAAAEGPAELDHQVVDLNPDQPSSAVSQLGDGGDQAAMKKARSKVLKKGKSGGKVSKLPTDPKAAMKKARSKVLKKGKSGGKVSKLAKAGFSAGFKEGAKDQKANVVGSKTAEKLEASSLKAAESAAEDIMKDAKKKVKRARAGRLKHANKMRKQAAHRVRSARREKKMAAKALAKAEHTKSSAKDSLAVIADTKISFLKSKSSGSVPLGRQEVKAATKLEAALVPVIKAGKMLAAATSKTAVKEAKKLVKAAAKAAAKAQDKATQKAPGLAKHPKMVKAVVKIQGEIEKLIDAKPAEASKLVRKMKSGAKKSVRSVASEAGVSKGDIKGMVKKEVRKAAGVAKRVLRKVTKEIKRKEIKNLTPQEVSREHRNQLQVPGKHSHKSIAMLVGAIKVAKANSKRAAARLKIAQAPSGELAKSADKELRKNGFQNVKVLATGDPKRVQAEMQGLKLKPKTPSVRIVEEGKQKLDSKARRVEKASVELARSTTKAGASAAKKKLKRAVRAQKRAVETEENLAKRGYGKNGKFMIRKQLIKKLSSPPRDPVSSSPPRDPMSKVKDETSVAKQMVTAVGAVIKAGKNFAKAQTKAEIKAAKAEVKTAAKLALKTEKKMIVKAPSLTKSTKLMVTGARVTSEIRLLIQAQTPKEVKKMHLIDNMQATLKGAKQTLTGKIDAAKRDPLYKAKKREAEEAFALNAAKDSAKSDLPPLVSAKQRKHYVKKYAEWGVTASARVAAKKKFAAVSAKAKRANDAASVGLPAAKAAAAKAKDKLDSAKEQAKAARHEAEIQPPAKVIVVQRGRKASHESDKIATASATVSAAAAKLAQAKTKKEQLNAEKELNAANTQEHKAIITDTFEKARANKATNKAAKGKIQPKQPNKADDEAPDV